MTRRIIICGACVATIVAVCVSVIMAVGIEVVQRAKFDDG